MPVSNTFRMVSVIALVLGIGSYFVGLFNATSAMSEKSFLFIVFLYGLYASVAIQKNTRDAAEGIPVSSHFNAMSWFSLVVSVVSTLWVLFFQISSMALSEKGFFMIAYFLSFFASIVVQKNVRDTKAVQ